MREKLHERRELEDILADVEQSEAANLSRKRTHGGGERKDWKSGREFKSVRWIFLFNQF
ncbi:hypothetical protein CY34DRAFT_809669 [Suillus luteus UH-Slu-Lm8-n1]|uniref:Uncharacterized protein n=1 Tax=Suillus luteus UH-Slu-Lm8-n1 TaxID=930992 RepID=A0A0D0A8S9_9AGAM|nr:hypothetical protein CY34DRAFT_809669 [Suillus luteus UH-Slu-Lm8-n1]